MSGTECAEVSGWEVSARRTTPPQSSLKKLPGVYRRAPHRIKTASQRKPSLYLPKGVVMSADQPSVGSGAHGLLRGQRAKSYGSLVTSSVSPVRQKRIRHKVQPGETLQGLSLKYGVTMEQIKRANRLYTNDPIFLKQILFIPVLTESLSFTNEEESNHQYQQDPVQNGQAMSESPEVTADISPSDYLKRMDGLIKQSKQAAIRTCQEGDKQFSLTEPVENRSQDSTSCSQASQQAMLGAVPLTITKRTKNLRVREDEIFQL